MFFARRGAESGSEDLLEELTWRQIPAFDRKSPVKAAATLSSFSGHEVVKASISPEYPDKRNMSAFFKFVVENQIDSLFVIKSDFENFSGTYSGVRFDYDRRRKRYISDETGKECTQAELEEMIMEQQRFMQGREDFDKKATADPTGAVFAVGVRFRE